MSKLRETLDNIDRALRERPDEILLEVGAGGELLVARLRIVVACLLIALPLLNYVAGGTVKESTAGLVGAGLIMLFSQLWLSLARRQRQHRWLPLVSSAFDVSMVSLVLMLLALETPAAALNSAVVWACYPLAVFATALRHDLRVTLATGGLALLQSALLWLVITTQYDGPLVSATYGTVTASTQLQRGVLLLAVTLVTAMVVFRAQRLALLSGTDGLTGLPNRSYLTLRVPQQVRDARDAGQTLSLALIDLDHFRHINAELGHQAGDRALRHAVDVLRLELGRDEPMIRVGGEEFVVILRRPIGAAWERLESLRRKLEGEPFVPGDGEEPRKLTFSAGLASCPQDANDLSGLMRRADLRLGQAKANGRNRVVARDAH